MTYLKDKKRMYAAGEADFVKNMTRCYVFLDVYKNSETKPFARSAKFHTNVSTMFIDVFSDEYTIPAGTSDEYRTVITAIYDDGSEGLHVLATTGQLVAEELGNSQDVVAEITVDAPKKTTEYRPERIIVAFNRESNWCDYSYPITRDPLSNLVMMSLLLKGEMTLVPGKKINHIDPGGIGIIARTEDDGIIEYWNDKENSVSIKEDKSGFSWSFPPEWNNTIPESTKIAQQDYALMMAISFKCQDDSSTYTIVVQSNMPENLIGDNSYKGILPLLLYWGCLQAGTLITLADGTQKPIEKIVIGDTLKTVEGSSAVTNITVGSESVLFHIITEKGKEVFASETHPMLTSEGFQRVIDFTYKTKLIMQDGGEEEIVGCFPVDNTAAVYGLDLDGAYKFYANGFVSGTSHVQQLDLSPKNPAPPIDDEILAEAEKLRKTYATEH
jgi:hypothetical protein